MWTGNGVVVAALGDGNIVRRSRGRILAFDGRLDNRRDLVRDLGMAGPADDAELVLAAHLLWGSDAAARLLGEFVAVLWDTSARHLVVIRDAMGAKSSYYRVEGGRRVLIATEVKQILAVPDVPRRLNEAAIVADLAGLYALPDMTAYEGIKQLSAGHILVTSRDTTTLTRYWFPTSVKPIRHRNQDDYAEHLLDVFAAAVQTRLPGDRRSAILLSGGVDSASIVATAGWLLERGSLAHLPLEAFSWAFDELADSDERRVARSVAEASRVPVVDVPADDAWPLSGGHEAGPDLDDPYSHMYQRLFDRSLRAAAERGCTQVFTADRGDAVMGAWVYDDIGLLAAGQFGALREDYRAYRQLHAAATGSYITRQLLQPLFSSVWPPGRFEWVRSRVPGRQASRPLPPWIPQRHAAMAHELRLEATRVPPIHGHARLLRHAAIFDVTGLRLGQLRQRSSARHGMVHTDPWSDRRIVEFALGVPQWRLHRHSRKKYLARRAMRGVMPESARRAARQGDPRALYRRAFNEREVRTVRELFATSRAAANGWLDGDAALAVYENYLRTGMVLHEFWFPLTMELWLRRWWQ